MSNPELAKYYLGLPAAQGKIAAPTPGTIISCLEGYSDGKWSWETTNEFMVMDNTMLCTNVVLYIPGRVLFGRAICPVKDSATNHLNALIDAAKVITTGGEVTRPRVMESPSSTTPTGQSTNMTVDQIQSALNANQQQPVSPPPVPPQQPPQQDDSDLPFYFGPTDPNAPPEVKAEYVAQQAAQQPQTPPQPQGGTQYPPDYDMPQERYKGFSQHQMDRMADFKRRAEVIDDTSLRNYIHMWNPNFCSKAHLTPQNVDEFFDWYDRMEPTRC